jgi:tRNA nucleotidyltransferase (CCA-adding enzyme)
MQFVARFALKPAPETLSLCRAMTPEGLAPERQFEEWRKLLVQGRSISSGLAFLRETHWVKYYPELAALIGCAQAPQWHPEGDVWNHTLCALDAFASQRTHDETEDLIVGLAVLCHDFGKPATSFFDRRLKRIRSLGHDDAGVAPTRAFLARLTNEERILKAVPPLVRLHMRPYAMWKSKSGEGAIRRLAAEVGRIDRLLRVCAADDAGRPPFPPEPDALRWLAAEAERLAVKDAAPKPLLQGRDLIALGRKPGPAFGPVLAAAYEAQLDGTIRTRDDAIAWAANN